MKSVLLRIPAVVVFLAALVSAASAKDEWIQVHSANFLLIGNASEKDIRKIAAHLELFRSAVSGSFKGDLASAIPANVVVFEDDASYTPYKPLKRDGKLDLPVEGYFESGADVNYITIAIGRGDDATYRTIFHEYVHAAVSAIYPKGGVPAWFNEGLAEYYSTFAVRNPGTATVGGPVSTHVKRLLKSTLLPLDVLLRRNGVDVSNSSIDERSLFYAESWAFVHYLIETGRNDAMNDFVKATLGGVPPEQAFKAAFHQDYQSMETALRSYVDHGSYRVARVDVGNPTDSTLEVRALSTSETAAYIGDLLLHMDRPAEAEIQLLTALADEPTNPIANGDIGMIRFQQHRLDEAKTYLKVAATSEHASASILFRYAFVLSREGLEPASEREDFDPATVKIMRDALHRAIAISPSLAGSYDLLAAIDLATDENLDEAATAMQTAARYEPDREGYALRLADVYVRQRKDDLAREIAERIARSPDPDLRRRANSILDYLRQTSDYNKKVADQAWLREHGEMAPLGPKTDPPLTRAEIEGLNALSTLRAINADLRLPRPGETRVLGTIESVDCGQGKIRFGVRSDNKKLALASPDFERVTFRTFDQDVGRLAIGCDSNLSARKAVVTYSSSLELVAIEFVPANFRFLTADEFQQPRAHLVRQDQVDSEGYSVKDHASINTKEPQGAYDERSRATILTALGPVADGEKREIGYIQGIECGSKTYLIIRTAVSVLRLQVTSPQDGHVRSFVPDLASSDLTCVSKPNDYPLVVTYKASTAGSPVVTSIAIVPREFRLD